MNTDELRERTCPFRTLNDGAGHAFRASDGLLYCERCGEVRHLAVTASPRRLTSLTVSGGKVSNVSVTQ